MPVVRLAALVDDQPGAAGFGGQGEADHRVGARRPLREAPGLDDPLAGDELYLAPGDVAVEGGELLARRTAGYAAIPDRADGTPASASTAYTWAGSAEIRACCVMLMMSVPSGSY